MKADREAQTVTVDLPKTFDEAWDIIHRFEKGAEPDEVVVDSVAHHALKGTGSLLDEPWHGSEASERLAYVTEGAWFRFRRFVERADLGLAQSSTSTPRFALRSLSGAWLTFSLQLMIVDDRRVIMGSANLNDRSQVGDHDSEIALVVEDTDMIPSRMNGEPVRPLSLFLRRTS